MTGEEILKRISQLSGLSTKSLINFCSVNMIDYNALNSYYMTFSKLPSVEDCAKLRAQSQINLQ